jgi:nucleotide-binding universal stress UspA family protein
MTIICGLSLDGDEKAILGVACMLAQAKRVIAVHVIGSAASESTIRASQLRLQQFCNQASEQFGLSSSTVDIRVLAGPIAETLGAIAETEGAEMLLVAANSKGVGSLGSVAAQLLTLSSVPVLLLRDAAVWIAAMTTQRRLRMLIGIDDSSVCDVAMAWVQSLAVRLPIHTVLGAIYYSDDAAARYGVAATKMVENNPVIEKMLARDMLRRWNADQSEVAHVEAHPKRGVGRIGDHLLEIAEQQGVDVVVVGTSQKTGLGKLGSVSSAVVAGASQSVLCIPPSTPVAIRIAPPMRCVLVATDCSAFANRAVPYAYSLCVGQPNAEVHIVHVRERADDSMDELQLSAVLKSLVPVGVTAATTVHTLQADETAVALAQCAARIGADVICMASHGRTGIARAVMGSVADQVLKQTTRPVMIVRPSS